MVYEEKTLRDQCRRFMGAFRARTDDFEVIYASKAFCTLAMCQLVEEEGLSIDVSAGGEYHTALVAGFPTGRMFYHGNNKTPGELGYALDNGIGFVVVDSLDEMELLESMAAERGERQRILLRITPGVEAHTHHYLPAPARFEIRFRPGRRAGRHRDSSGDGRTAPGAGEVLHAHIGSRYSSSKASGGRPSFL